MPEPIQVVMTCSNARKRNSPATPVQLEFHATPPAINDPQNSEPISIGGSATILTMRDDIAQQFEEGRQYLFSITPA